LKRNNGGEYCGTFSFYSKQYGIEVRKNPSPKISQLNGLVKKPTPKLLPFSL